jgi:GTPase involved in cell partitioning and DNA repair
VNKNIEADDVEKDHWIDRGGRGGGGGGGGGGVMMMMMMMMKTCSHNHNPQNIDAI